MVHKQRRHTFLYISLPSLYDYDVKVPIFTFSGREVNTKRRFYKSFEKIVELNSRKIHQIENLIKRHGIRDANFKTARIHLRDVFSVVVVVVASHRSDAISKHLTKETIVDPIIYHLNTLLTELSVYLCGDFRLERSTG